MRVSDAFDERIDYTLDAMGGRTLEQISTAGGAAIAKTQSRVFDDLGRLLLWRRIIRRLPSRQAGSRFDRCRPVPSPSRAEHPSVQVSRSGKPP